jgi:AraC family transcriptional regulator
MLLRWMSEMPVSVDDKDREIRNVLFRAVLYEFDQVQRPVSDQLESRLRRYLQNHLAETLTLDDLASAVGMTKYHFVRKFRGLTGLPPMAYLRRMRVSAAETLLLNTALPLKAIAPQVGFSDEYHLSRVFRNENGLSPSQYRRERALAAERARSDTPED